MKWIIPSILALLSAGCANDYSCNQYPDSGCQPVSSVYGKTNHGFNDYRKNLFDESEEKKSDSENITVAPSFKAINHVVAGDPILSKPIVLRVFINDYIDKSGDLNAASYVYMRLNKGTWINQ